jgi:hypothetical protein
MGDIHHFEARQAHRLRATIGNKFAAISPRGWEIVAGLVAPVLLLGTLLGGESVVRFQQYRAFGANQAFETKLEKTIWEEFNGRRRPLPGANMGRIHFNANGFRGEELASPKPKGLIRVGFFGTSTTMDPYVDRETDTWPAIVVSRLREEFPGCKFDYLNAGVAGYDLMAVKSRLVEDAMPLQPDIAVIMVNDITARGRDQLGGATGVYKPSWLASRSLLWLKLEKTAESERLKRAAERIDASKRLDLDAMSRDVRRDIRAVLDQVEKLKLATVLVENASRLRREQPLPVQAENALSEVLYLPNVYVGDLTESYYRYNGELRAAARDYRISYIPTMDRIPATPAYYVDTHHTTKAGSRILGQIVGDSLAADPSIRTLVRDRGNNCAAGS